MMSLDQLIPHVADKNRPATPKQIESFVKKLAFDPPADYLDFLRLCNGASLRTDLEADEEPDLQFYNIAETLAQTRDYAFDEHCPGLFIIGTDGFDRVFCLDGRYSPARIIGTYFDTPGDIGASIDFGVSFLGFLGRLLGDETEFKPGLPPLPDSVPAEEVTVLPLPDALGIAADPNDGAVWVCFPNFTRKLELPSGTVLDETPLAGHSRFWIGSGGRVALASREQMPEFTQDLCAVADLHTGQIVHRLGSDTCVGLAHNGDALFAYAKDSIEIFDLASGRRLQSVPSSNGDAVSPDGRWMIRREDADGILHLDELATGQRHWTAPIDKVPYTRFLFSSDGKTLIGQNWDEKMAAWDMATGKRRYRCGDKKHPGGEWALVPNSPTNDFVTSHLRKSTVVLWNGQTGKPRKQLHVNTETQGFLTLASPVITRDGKYVLFLTQSRNLIAWRL